MRRYCLYTLAAPDSSGLLHQVGQFPQILIAKQTPSCSQDHEWILRQQCRPARWNGPQKATAIMKVNSILAPVMTICDQFETLASQRMVWMDDFKSTVGTVGIRCS